MLVQKTKKNHSVLEIVKQQYNITFSQENKLSFPFEKTQYNDPQ